MDAVFSAWAFFLVLIRVSLRHYLVVIGCVLIGVFLMAGFAVIKGPLYTSTMTVKTADDPNAAGGLSSALSRLPLGLGIGGGGGSGSLLFAYLNLLQSNEVAAALINNDHFENVLFRDSLDPVTGLYRQDGWLAGVRRAVNDAFGIRKADRPMTEDVQRTLKEMLVVNSDELTGLVTISCTSPRPTLCRDTLLLANKEAQASLNRMRRTQAQKTRDYLEQVLPTVPESDVRSNMVASLVSAKSQIAMSNLENSIGASIIDPPLVPTQPSFPRPVFLILLGFALGLLLGIGISFLIGDRALRIAAPPYVRVQAS